MFKLRAYLSRDVVAAGLLVGIVVLFLVPTLLRWIPPFYDDAPVQTIPRAMAIARSLQQGGIPLWDFNTFAGAKPFYADEGATTFYPLMYPFYLLADLDDLEQSTFMIVLLPYCFHVIWAALGAFLFGRLGLRLHPAGAFVMGLMYALSPELITVGVVFTDVACMFSHLPWVMLAVARFMETGSIRSWAFGSFLLALMSTVGFANYLMRIYVLVGASIGLLWLFSVRKTGNSRYAEIEGHDGACPGGFISRVRYRMRRGDFHLSRLFAAAGMLVIGAGMSGFVLGGLAEGASWITHTVEMTVERAAGTTSESSLPPLCLLGLFVPSFFGVLDSSHAWGTAVANRLSTATALTGGMCVMTAALSAAWSCVRRRGSDERELLATTWARVACVTLVVFLFTILGRYTFVFRWLCGVLPWFFRVPHATYYRFAVSWSVMILAAVGVSHFATMPVAARRTGVWWIAAGCVLIAGVLGGISLLDKRPYRG